MYRDTGYAVQGFKNDLAVFSVFFSVMVIFASLMVVVVAMMIAIHTPFTAPQVLLLRNPIVGDQPVEKLTILKSNCGRCLRWRRVHEQKLCLQQSGKLQIINCLLRRDLCVNVGNAFVFLRLNVSASHKDTTLAPRKRLNGQGHVNLESSLGNLNLHMTAQIITTVGQKSVQIVLRNHQVMLRFHICSQLIPEELGLIHLD
mmetsp:Transcript_10389/g.21359  ORF Transcript_10389/g.21359 Transcript_10389/m.21359 type:complete len:201 (-) Transcript_10389:346-948(-)